MKKLIFGALSVLIMTACSNENEILRSDMESSTINVQLSLISASDGTRANNDYIWATEDERKVTSLDAYMFADGKLEKHYSNLITEEWTPAVTDEKKTVSLPGIINRTAKSIYFIANGNDISSLKDVTAGTTTEADFQTFLTDEITVNPTTPLAMTTTASVTEENWEGTPLSIQVTAAAMQRIVARIDLTVNTQEDVTFVPTEVKMLKARNASYLFPNDATAATASVDLTTTNIPTGETVASGTTYRSLLYPYEAPATDNAVLEVKGQLTVGEKTPVEATFKLPFVNDNGENIAIERNTCYNVTITKINGLSSIVNAEFTIQAWQDGETIEYPIYAENFTVNGLTEGNQLEFAASGESKVLTVSTNVAWKATSSADFVTVTAEGEQLTITTTANETGAVRKGYVVLSTDADPNVNYTIVVTQVAN